MCATIAQSLISRKAFEVNSKIVDLGSAFSFLLKVDKLVYFSTQTMQNYVLICI